MTFAPVKPGGWASEEVLTSAQMNALQAQLGSASRNAIIETFTVSGVWAKPSGALWIFAYLVGNGGPGAIGNATTGGGGGGSGYLATWSGPASLLPSGALSLTIGGALFNSFEGSPTFIMRALHGVGAAAGNGGAGYSGGQGGLNVASSDPGPATTGGAAGLAGDAGTGTTGGVGVAPIAGGGGPSRPPWGASDIGSKRGGYGGSGPIPNGLLVDVTGTDGNQGRAGINGRGYGGGGGGGGGGTVPGNGALGSTGVLIIMTLG